MYIVVTITTVARSDQIIWAHMLQCALLEPSLWSETVTATSRSRMVLSSSSQWTDSHKLQLSQHWRQWLQRSANIHIGIAMGIVGGTIWRKGWSRWTGRAKWKVTVMLGCKRSRVATSQLLTQSISRWIPGHAWRQETVTCRDLSIAESVVHRITCNAQRITKDPGTKISWRIRR